LVRKVGFHVSIAGGIANSVDNAKAMGCTAFQIFSRNPRGWASKPLAKDDVQLFKNKLSASGIERSSTIVHMPYLPNLSAGNNEIYKKSVETLSEEMQRCVTLEIPYLVIHLGSYKETSAKAGFEQLINAISKARAKNQKRPIVLLENNAGQTNRLGGKFEELRMILDKLNDPKEFGVCLDTCHLFASGHDLRTEGEVDNTLDKFANIVGFKELKFIHLNDSKWPFASARDEHEHLGVGHIGPKGLAAFLNHRAIKDLPAVIETDDDDKRPNDMKFVLEVTQ
jgi:deoxyribonuclease-4